MDHKATTALRDLEHILVEETDEPKALPLSLLEDITGHFSDDMEIGRGGFAVVYQGKLGDKKVAVKRLSKAYMHEKEFDQEVQCLIRAKHKNVVRFLGYCDDRQRNMERCDEKLLMADVHQRLMCFEYMPKGSLDNYINTHLEWETCYKIIKGICEGLQYLHDNRIIHLDLKPANILLDNDMVPKITDFGLSRCLDENQSQVLTKTVLGTTGYLAPERFQGSGIKPSGDLYSLGIIIMEILTGQKAHQTIEDVFESWTDRLERSQQDTVYGQIRACYEIASNCTQYHPKDRPASAQAIIDRLHEMERIQKLRESAIIGILEVEILGTRDLAAGMESPYVVAKYGKKWVRSCTLLDTTAPQWNEQWSWDVFDVNTVITVAVFNDSHGDANDQRIGKVRVRLATLETERMYTQCYPLMALRPCGLMKKGELQLAVRFTCKSWANMLAQYGRPLLPKMHYINPISVQQRDYLRFQAMGMVASRLGRAHPPLRKEVVEYVLDVDSNMFSLRRSKANFNRITLLFSGGVAVAVGKWFDGICKWKNPVTTILVHVVFLKLVCYPELILPIVFLCMIIIGAWNYSRRPRGPPYIDTMLSRVDPNELDEELDGLQPPSYIDTMLRWYKDVSYPDELDEEFDTFPTSRPPDIVMLRYERLRSLAGMLQTVVGDLAIQGERAQSLLSWRDPRATAIFITLLPVLAAVLYLTPFRVLAMVMLLYFLRPPWFRGRNDLLLNLYSRLPSRVDTML